MLPNFLVIGAARCGTTWIHECLKEHPDVCVPAPLKEIHFFNREANFSQGLGWYERFFEHHAGERATGEVTPSYLCLPVVPERIYRHLPSVRLIASLRNPADRAHSSYLGHVLSGRVMKGEGIVQASERLVFDNQSSIIDHGFYYRHLQRYLRYFARAQILVLLFDDLVQDSTGFIRSIYRFLGVDDSFSPSVLGKRANVGRYSEALRMVNRVLRRLLPPVTPRLYRIVESAMIGARKKLVRQELPELSEEVRAELKAIYRDDILQLAEFLDRDLSSWL